MDFVLHVQKEKYFSQSFPSFLCGLFREVGYIYGVR